MNKNNVLSLCVSLILSSSALAQSDAAIYQVDNKLNRSVIIGNCYTVADQYHNPIAPPNGLSFIAPYNVYCAGTETDHTYLGWTIPAGGNLKFSFKPNPPKQGTLSVAYFYFDQGLGGNGGQLATLTAESFKLDSFGGYLCLVPKGNNDYWLTDQGPCAPA